MSQVGLDIASLTFDEFDEIIAYMTNTVTFKLSYSYISFEADSPPVLPIWYITLLLQTMCS